MTAVAPPAGRLGRGWCLRARAAWARAVATFDDHPRTDAATGPRRHWQRLAAAVYAHPLAADTALTAALGTVSTIWLLRLSPTPGLLVLQAALVIPLIWRRRYPIGVFVALSLIGLAQWAAADRLLADLSLLVALYTVARHRPRRIALAATAIIEVGVVMATIRWPLTDSWIRSLVFLSTMAAAALLLGVNVRGRQAHLATLIERAERLEHERDQQARLSAIAERTRIAREMHDVLAHSLAVMVSLADGATAKLSHEPQRAAEAIAHVSEIGRQSLRDTRSLLGVLRADDSPGPTAPQPDVSQLGELMTRVRSTGLDASLSITGETFEIPPGAGLTVYRIVQEALTNSLKHATDARRVHVRLHYHAPNLDVDVDDDGRRSTLSANGRAETETTTGHGLAGMRERASVYNGSVVAGPGPAGGWRVQARLPIGLGGTR